MVDSVSTARKVAQEHLSDRKLGRSRSISPTPFDDLVMAGMVSNAREEIILPCDSKISKMRANCRSAEVSRNDAGSFIVKCCSFGMMNDREMDSKPSKSETSVPSIVKSSKFLNVRMSVGELRIGGLGCVLTSRASFNLRRELRA